MIYLPDTNVCIRYLRDAKGPIGVKLRSLPAAAIKSCEIVAAELYFGCYKSNRLQENLKATNEFLGFFECLPFDLRAAETFGKLRAELEKTGQRIGPYDLQIAAIALANDATLVTHNVREFSRVRGLQIEDWEATA